MIDGLRWGDEHKFVEIAYGIRKLVVSCVIVDDMVGVNDITDSIEAMEDIVQSVDMLTMNVRFLFYCYRERRVTDVH